jgi:hypothetical protein
MVVTSATTTKCDVRASPSPLDLLVVAGHRMQAQRVRLEVPVAAKNVMAPDATESRQPEERASGLERRPLIDTHMSPPLAFCANNASPAIQSVTLSCPTPMRPRSLLSVRV